MSSHLSNDEVRSRDSLVIRKLTLVQFFTRLVSLLETRQQKGHGSIFLTQKRRTQTILSYSPSALTHISDLRRFFCLQTHRFSSCRSGTSVSTSTHSRSRDRRQLANKGSQKVREDQAQHSCTTRWSGSLLHSLRRSLQTRNAGTEEERPQQEKEAEAGQEEGTGRQEMSQHTSCWMLTSNDARQI